MEYIVPNRIIFLMLKNNLKEINDFGSIYNDIKFKKFCCNNACGKVLNYCECDGKMIYGFLGKGDVIIHKSNGIKNNVYISILSNNTSYYDKISSFFYDYKNQIDLSGNTYILDKKRFVCEFIRDKKTIAYE